MRSLPLSRTAASIAWELTETSHSASVMPLLLAQDEIQRPASSNVRAGRTQMWQDRRFSASGVFQSVRQDSEGICVQMTVGRRAVVIGGLSQPPHQTTIPGQPRFVDCPLRKGAGDAENVSEKAEVIAF